MKDKLLQILNEIETELKYASFENINSLDNHYDVSIKKSIIKLSEAKQLLSAPIAEQGEEEIIEMKPFKEAHIKKYYGWWSAEQISFGKFCELLNQKAQQWAKDKYASQSPIKQEVSEEEIKIKSELYASEIYDKTSNLESVMPEEYLWANRASNFYNGFKAGQQHSIGKVTDSDLKKYEDEYLKATDSKGLSVQSAMRFIINKLNSK